MSQDKELNRFALLLRILGAAAIVLAAGLLGMLAGRVTAPDLLPPALPEEDVAEAEDELPARVV